MDNARLMAESIQQHSSDLQRRVNELEAKLTQVEGEAQVHAEARDRLEAKLERALELLEMGWTVIANANSGNWDQASPEWREAAVRWLACGIGLWIWPT